MGKPAEGKTAGGRQEGAKPRGTWARRAGLTTTLLLALLLGVGVPLAVPLLNLAAISGFPLGLYMVAEGGPLLLALLLGVHVGFAVRRERLIKG